MEPNLRGLFKCGGHNGSVAYEKEPGQPCYIIGSEGENILMVEKPSRASYHLFTGLVTSGTSRSSSSVCVRGSFLAK